MQKTYRAILDGDRVRWTNGSPPPVATPREVQITVIEPDHRRARGRAMAAAAEAIARSGAFSQITDPVAWQNEMREDHPTSAREAGES